MTDWFSAERLPNTLERPYRSPMMPFSPVILLLVLLAGCADVLPLSIQSGPHEIAQELRQQARALRGLARQQQLVSITLWNQTPVPSAVVIGREAVAQELLHRADRADRLAERLEEQRALKDSAVATSHHDGAHIGRATGKRKGRLWLLREQEPSLWQDCTKATCYLTLRKP